MVAIGRAVGRDRVTGLNHPARPSLFLAIRGHILLPSRDCHQPSEDVQRRRFEKSIGALARLVRLFAPHSPLSAKRPLEIASACDTLDP